jgi:hypothetical protein
MAMTEVLSIDADHSKINVKYQKAMQKSPGCTGALGHACAYDE